MTMPMGEIFTVSIDALRVNKLRSLLTMLGIIIGVSAVIAMLALGTGAQQAVNERITSLGTTLVTVVPGQVFTGGIASATDRARLQMEDAQALQERGTSFVAVQPEMGRGMAVQFRQTNTNTQIIGSSPNYLEVRKYVVANGRMFDRGEDEGRKRVAVVGATTASNLGLGEALVGQEIRIAGNSFEVIGVLAPKGG